LEVHRKSKFTEMRDATKILLHAAPANVCKEFIESSRCMLERAIRVASGLTLIETRILKEEETHRKRMFF
jgi:hypothetical protein